MRLEFEPSLSQVPHMFLEDHVRWQMKPRLGMLVLVGRQTDTHTLKNHKPVRIQADMS